MYLFSTLKTDRCTLGPFHICLAQTGCWIQANNRSNNIMPCSILTDDLLEGSIDWIVVEMDLFNFKRHTHSILCIIFRHLGEIWIYDSGTRWCVHLRVINIHMCTFRYRNDNFSSELFTIPCKMCKHFECEDVKADKAVISFISLLSGLQTYA